MRILRHPPRSRPRNRNNLRSFLPALRAPHRERELPERYHQPTTARQRFRLDLTMADASIGVPVTFHILRKLWPGKENEYLDYLKNNLRSDEALLAGTMHGGQQFVDYMIKRKDGAPMGLARFLLEDAARTRHEL
jgi:hypothetical protein